MPIYECVCQDCGASFEILVRDSTRVACPQCGSASLRRLLSAPFVSTGRARRQSASTCCGREERCSALPCSDGGKCRRD
jgi:putative FmdB family regulatory protein